MVGTIEAFGDLATGALAAQAVDGATIGQAHADAGGHGACLNCAEAVIGPHCHRCGQAAHVHRTLGALFHDLAHGVFHFEGRTWSTLPMLAWRPGELTRRYIAGERVRFVSPMPLFLFAVFLMYVSFSTLGGPFAGKVDTASVQRAGSEIGKERQKAADRVAGLTAARAALPAGSDARIKVDAKLEEARADLDALNKANRAAGMAAAVTAPAGDKPQGTHIDIGVPAIDHAVERAIANPELLYYKMETSAYKFSWLLIPISLPFIWGLFAFRRDVGLYDHAIFAIYSLSFMTLLMVALTVARVIGMGQGAIAMLMLAVPPVHMFRHLRGAYRIGALSAAARTLALLMSASIATVIFIAALLSLEIAH